MEQNTTKRIAKNTVISSLIWKFLERGGVQGGPCKIFCVND